VLIEPTRGLKWEDLDVKALWINLRRGLVRKDETKMKTKASRKGVSMAPELADVLLQWRQETPYPQALQAAPGTGLSPSILD
jgi:hypothetical protein